jgi:hypothetical protein
MIIQQFIIITTKYLKNKHIELIYFNLI